MGLYGLYPDGEVGVQLWQSVTFDAAVDKVAHVVDVHESLFNFRIARATAICRECFTGSGTAYVDVFNETQGNTAARIYLNPVIDGAATGSEVFVSAALDDSAETDDGDKLLIRYNTSTDAYANGVVVRLWVTPSNGGIT